MRTFLDRWRWTLGLVVALGGAIGLAGCGGSKSAGSSRPGRPWKVVVVRFGPGAELPEPSDADIRDGMALGGITDKAAYTLDDRDTGGDLNAAAQAVESASDDGADLIIALHPKVAQVAAAKAGKVPVVFSMFGNPFALGLGQSDRNHPPGIVGVYTSFDQSHAVLIARWSLPKAERFGVLFNPDNPESVAHKDALVRWSGVQAPSATRAIPMESAEFRAPDEVAAATRTLLDRKVDAIFLTLGIGRGAGAAIREATGAKVPVFGFNAAQVRDGAIAATVAEPRWGGFEAGRRAARVLRGESTASIPYQSQGAMVETYHSPAVSKALGVTLRPEILRGAIAVVAKNAATATETRAKGPAVGGLRKGAGGFR